MVLDMLELAMTVAAKCRALSCCEQVSLESVRYFKKLFKALSGALIEWRPLPLLN